MTKVRLWEFRNSQPHVFNDMFIVWHFFPFIQGTQIVQPLDIIKVIFERWNTKQTAWTNILGYGSVGFYNKVFSERVLT